MVTSWYHGSLPFAQTTWVEILCINIKLKNFTCWENYPLQRISKSAEKTKKSTKIDSPQITAHTNLLSFLYGIARTIWFSNRNFRISHINGKCLCYVIKRRNINYLSVVQEYYFTENILALTRKRLNGLKKFAENKSCKTKQQFDEWQTEKYVKYTFASPVFRSTSSIIPCKRRIYMELWDRKKLLSYYKKRNIWFLSLPTSIIFALNRACCCLRQDHSSF